MILLKYATNYPMLSENKNAYGSTLSQVSEIEWLEEHIALLEEYASECRTKDRKFELNNGERISAQTGIYLYRFARKGAGFADNENLLFLINGEEIEGSIASTNDLHTIINLKEDQGNIINKLTVVNDTSGLYLELKERLKNTNDGPFNHSLVDRLLQGANPRAVEPIIPDVTISESFSEEQRQAIKHANQHDILFLWGPPGTGKTKTLAAIVLNHYRAGHRILIASNTNLAVDELVHNFCKLLGTDAGLQAGEIIRFGKVDSKELKEDFGPLVMLKEVKERIATALKQEEQQLKVDQVELQKQLRQLTEKLDIFDKYLQISEQLEQQLSKHKEALDNYYSLNNIYAKNNLTYQNLLSKLHKKQTTNHPGKWFGPSIKTMQEEVQQRHAHLTKQEIKLKKLQDQCAQIDTAIGKLKEQKKHMEEKLPDEEVSALKQNQSNAIKQLDNIEQRLNAIGKELRGIEVRLTKNAKVSYA